MDRKNLPKKEEEKMFLPCTQIQRSCAPLLGSSRHVRVYGCACLCVCASVRVGGRTVDFKVVPHRKAEKMLLIFQCFGKFSQSYITIMITILLKKIVFSTKKTRGGVVRRVKNSLEVGRQKPFPSGLTLPYCADSQHYSQQFITIQGHRDNTKDDKQNYPP